MFGWFKRLIGKRDAAHTVEAVAFPVTYRAKKPLESYVFVRGVRVRARNHAQALDLVLRIDAAKRNKKKHSHLQEQLKALEVK